MDWSDAIEINREALKRLLAMLVAMVGLGTGQSAVANRQPQSAKAADGSSNCPLPTADCRPTLPRHLHRAVLSLLRPAEAAARRLIIVVARGLEVALPPPSPRKPKPASTILRGGVGTGIVMPRGFSPGHSRAAPRSLALPLTDPLPRWDVRARPVASGFPRISVPGLTLPSPIPRPPAPDDPIDAARLVLRLGALARALDDLPAQARRFARWKAGRDRALAAGRIHRVTPLRPGRPPGGRLSRYDPDAPRRKNIRDVDEILAHCHALASYAPNPDTS